VPTSLWPHSTDTSRVGGAEKLVDQGQVHPTHPIDRPDRQLPALGLQLASGRLHGWVLHRRDHQPTGWQLGGGPQQGAVAGFGAA
jgi:hypothetical protein